MSFRPVPRHSHNPGFFLKLRVEQADQAVPAVSISAAAVLLSNQNTNLPENCSWRGSNWLVTPNKGWPKPGPGDAPLP